MYSFGVFAFEETIVGHPALMGIFVRRVEGFGFVGKAEVFRLGHHMPEDRSQRPREASPALPGAHSYYACEGMGGRRKPISPVISLNIAVDTNLLMSTTTYEGSTINSYSVFQFRFSQMRWKVFIQELVITFIRQAITQRLHLIKDILRF